MHVEDNAGDLQDDDGTMEERPEDRYGGPQDLDQPYLGDEPYPGDAEAYGDVMAMPPSSADYGLDFEYQEVSMAFMAYAIGALLTNKRKLARGCKPALCKWALQDDGLVPNYIMGLKIFKGPSGLPCQERCASGGATISSVSAQGSEHRSWSNL